MDKGQASGKAHLENNWDLLSWGDLGPTNRVTRQEGDGVGRTGRGAQLLLRRAQSSALTCRG